MKISTLLFPAALALAITPVHAQCGGGHSGHSDNGPAHNHSAHQESSARVKATNTICPVMGEAVTPGHDREVVIRGHYYLVCCGGCGPEMSEHYDKYLDQEGRPLNDPKRDPRRADENPITTPSSHEGHQH